MEREVTKREVTKRELVEREVTKRELVEREVTKQELVKREGMKRGIEREGMKRGIEREGMKRELLELCCEYFGVCESELRYELLSGAGSNRRYYRVWRGENETGKDSRTGGGSMMCGGSIIGVEGELLAENEAFLSMSESFRAGGLRVALVLGVSSDRLCYILEDLGNEQLLHYIDNYHRGIDCSYSWGLICKAVEGLGEFQRIADSVVDYAVCYPRGDFGRRNVMWDLNYFKYCYLKLSGKLFDESLLEDYFEELCDKLLDGVEYSFMYRDYQSRNIMVRDGDIYFIDFQGGRRGPVYYDIVSFLWQSKAGFSDSEREELLCLYERSSGRHLDRERYWLYVLFRLLQVLGAYGYRGLYEGKVHFLESLPIAERNVRELLSSGVLGDIRFKDLKI